MSSHRGILGALRWRNAFAMATGILDLLTIAGSLAIGFVLNFPGLPIERFFSQQWKLLLFSTSLFLSLNAMLGVYRDAYTTPFRTQISAALRSHALGTLFVFSTLFLFRNTYYRQGILLTFLIVLPVTALCVRACWNAMRNGMHRAGFGRITAASLCVDDASEAVLEPLVGHPTGGFAMTGIFRIQSAGELPQQVIETACRSDCVLIAASSLSALARSGLLTRVRVLGIHTRVITPEIHATLSKIRIYGWSGVHVAGPPEEGRRIRILKRAFDLTLGSASFVLLSPLLALVSLVIRIESGAPTIIRQRRALSHGSREVAVLKFRSMRREAGGQEVESGPNGDDGDILFKNRDDPRRTPLGRFLRKLSIDELPQLVNVISGTMSLVGPRPLPVEHFGHLHPEDPVRSIYDVRARMKPGMTGLWQVSGRSHLGFREMVYLDLYYAEHSTLIFDLEILLQTVPAVLTGHGAY